MSEDKVKSEAEIIFPEAKVGDIIVKPWSFGKLFEILESLDKVLDKADEKGILEQLEVGITGGMLSYIPLMRLFAVARNEILDIIAKTTDTDIEKIKSLSTDEGIKLVMVIFRQNKEVIMNSVKNALSTPSRE